MNSKHPLMIETVVKDWVNAEAECFPPVRIDKAEDFHEMDCGVFKSPYICTCKVHGLVSWHSAPQISGTLEISKLELRPGDTLVVRASDEWLSSSIVRCAPGQSPLEQLADCVSKHVPEGVHVLVIDKRTEIMPLKGGASPERTPPQRIIELPDT